MLLQAPRLLTRGMTAIFLSLGGATPSYYSTLTSGKSIMIAVRIITTVNTKNIKTAMDTMTANYDYCDFCDEYCY